MKNSALATAAAILPLSCQRSPQPVSINSPGRFTFWQLPSQTPSQMNSYVIKTQTGKIVVIDGGNGGDAPYLKGFLAACGNRVDVWFVSHPHPDHVDALSLILNNTADLKIDAIYGSIPPESWIEKFEPQYLPTVSAFNQALKNSSHQITELTLGQTIIIDGVVFKIIGIKNPEITSNAINNSCVVIKVTGRQKNILFLGDLGGEGGRKLLNSPYAGELPSDYVQMAHHGQNGVDETFYRAVNPQYCLWPTPLWLWDCDSGLGKGSGPWDTLNVRAWMEKLNVKKHYVSAFGLCEID